MVLCVTGSACRLLPQRGSCSRSRNSLQGYLALCQQAAAACCCPRSRPIKDPGSKATQDVLQARQMAWAKPSIWQVTLVPPRPCPAPRDASRHVCPHVEPSIWCAAGNPCHSAS